MIETPQLTDVTATDIAFISLAVAHADMPKVMGPGIQEVMAVAKAQDVGPTGPWFTHHKRITSTGFDFEICVPVRSPVTPVGRVLAGKVATRKAARTVYHGGYEGLSGAWQAFGEWIAAQGLKPASDLYECYRVGPESSSDPADWRTELTRPLLG